MSITDKDIRDLPLPSKGKKRHPLGASMYLECRAETILKDGTKGGGGKYIYWQYRFPAGRKGKQEHYYIGVYGRGVGKWTINQAREKRNELEVKRREGIDPKRLKSNIKKEKQDMGVYTFKHVATEWLGSRGTRLSKTTLKDYRNKLENQIYEEDFANSPIKLITRPEAIEFKRRHEARGKTSHADRLFRLCKQVFEYAIDMGWVDTLNPFRHSNETKSLHKAEKSLTLVNWNEVPPFLKDLSENKCNSDLISNSAVKVQVITFLRSASLVSAQWSEIDWDKRIWTIPAEAMKGRLNAADRMKAKPIPEKDHLIPMPDLLIEILMKLRAMSGHTSHLFISPRPKSKPHINQSTPNHVIKNLGYQGKLVAHGLRAMALTHGQEVLKANPEIIRLQMGHAIGDKVRQAYDRAQFLPERKEFMDQWANLLNENGLVA